MFFYLTRWSRRNSLYAYALRTFADDKPLLPLILLFILSLIVFDVDDDDENSEEEEESAAAAAVFDISYALNRSSILAFYRIYSACLQSLHSLQLL